MRALIIAAVAVALLVGAALSAPRYAARHVEDRAAAHGVALRVEGPSLRPGRAGADRVTMEHPRASLRCEGVRARGALLDVVRQSVPLERVRVRSCTLSLAPSRTEGDEELNSSAEGATLSDMVRAALDAADAARGELGRWADVVEIEALRVASTPTGVAEASMRAVRLERSAWSLEANAATRAGTLSGALRCDAAACEGEARVALIDEGALDVTVARLDREGALARVRAAERELAEVEARWADPRPRVRVDVGELTEAPEALADTLLRFTGGAPELEHEATSPPEGGEPWDPLEALSSSVDALDRRWERLWAFAEQLPVPPLDLSLHGRWQGAALPALCLGSGWAPETPPSGRVCAEPSADTWRLHFDAVPLGLLGLLGEEARLDGSLTVGRREAHFHGTLLEAELSAPAIARDLITIPEMAWELRLEREEAAHRFTASATRAATRWAAALEVREGEVELRADVAGPCALAWETIPEAMLPALGHDAIAWSGELEAMLIARVSIGDPESFSLDVNGLPGGCVIDAIAPAWDPAQLLDPTWTMSPREGAEEQHLLGPGAPSYVTLAALPSYAPALMYLSEEIAFPTNPGVSVGLIERGMRANLREGRYVYGGSTVTQQLVKNVFLRRDKTLARKLEELVLAWAVEQALPKERILELYLNVIEFGPEVWGFAAAARHYFDRDADALTPLEVAFLATLMPAPHEGPTYRRRGRSNTRGWWPDRLRVLLERLVEHGGFIDASEAEAYGPYVVALRRDEATLDAKGQAVLGDGQEVTRIERPEDAARTRGWGPP